jgi:hypothetical protein
MFTRGTAVQSIGNSSLPRPGADVATSGGLVGARRRFRAVVGGIAGGGTGAAIGAVARASGTVLATKGREIQVPAGTIVDV